FSDLAALGGAVHLEGLGLHGVVFAAFVQFGAQADAVDGHRRGGEDFGTGGDPFEGFFLGFGAVGGHEDFVAVGLEGGGGFLNRLVRSERIPSTHLQTPYIPFRTVP